MKTVLKQNDIKDKSRFTVSTAIQVHTKNLLNNVTLSHIIYQCFMLILLAEHSWPCGILVPTRDLKALFPLIFTSFNLTLLRWSIWKIYTVTHHLTCILQMVSAICHNTLTSAVISMVKIMFSLLANIQMHSYYTFFLRITSSSVTRI